MKLLKNKFLYLIISKGLKIGAGLMITVAFLLIYNTFEKKEMVDANMIVIMDVIEAPLSCRNLSTRGGYCKLLFKGETYGKKAGNKFCHLVSGNNQVRMLSNKDQDYFIFEGEYDPMQFVFASLLIFIGVIILIKDNKTS